MWMGISMCSNLRGWREALCEVLLRRYGNQTPRPWLRVSPRSPNRD